MLGEDSITPLQFLRQALDDGRLRDAVRRRKHGDALGTAHGALKEYGDAIKDLVALETVSLEVCNHLDEHSRAKLTQKLKAIQRMGQALTQESNTELLTRSRSMLSDTKRLVDDVSGELGRGWSKRIRSEFEAIGELADALLQMRAEKALAMQMKQIAEQGKALEGQFPPDDSGLEELRSRLDAREKALNALSKLGSNLGEFLLNVASGKATLADLNEDVLKWLRKQDAMERFSIRL